MRTNRIHAASTSADRRLVAVALLLGFLVFALGLIRIGPIDTSAIDSETAVTEQQGLLRGYLPCGPPGSSSRKSD